MLIDNKKTKKRYGQQEKGIIDFKSDFLIQALVLECKTAHIVTAPFILLSPDFLLLWRLLRAVIGCAY